MRWAGDVLVDAGDVFTFAPAVEKHGEGADVEGVGAEPDEVGGDAGELVEEDTKPLRAVGDLEAEELFDGEAVAEIVGHRRQIVDAIGEGNDLLVELGLAGLLDAGVQVADVGGAGDDGLAVDLEDETEDAMRRGMLGAHVEDHGLVAGAAGVFVMAGGVGPRHLRTSGMSMSGAERGAMCGCLPLSRRASGSLRRGSPCEADSLPSRWAS